MRDHPALRAIAAQAAMLFRVDQHGGSAGGIRHGRTARGQHQPDKHGCRPAAGGRGNPGTAAGLRNVYTFDIAALTTVKVHAATEDQARSMIDGLTSITTRTAGDDIETAYGLERVHPRLRRR